MLRKSDSYSAAKTEAMIVILGESVSVCVCVCVCLTHEKQQCTLWLEAWRQGAPSMKDTVREAEAAILAATSEAEVRRICDEAHVKIARHMLALQQDEKVSLTDLKKMAKEALEGLEASVPLPPLPACEAKKRAAQAEPAEQAESPSASKGTDFKWLFHTMGADVVSVLKASSMQ